jgi:uncharacterized protein YjbJ (UPF0337 family)
MNWDQIEADWMQFKGKVRNNWVKLTDEDLTRIGGRREELAERLQARYGFAEPKPSARLKRGGKRSAAPRDWRTGPDKSGRVDCTSMAKWQRRGRENQVHRAPSAKSRR